MVFLKFLKNSPILPQLPLCQNRYTYVLTMLSNVYIIGVYQNRAISKTCTLLYTQTSKTISKLGQLTAQFWELE